MTNESKSAIFEKYKEWRPLTDKEKILKGLPQTQREFSITHGISQQALSDWNDKIDGNAKAMPNIHSLEDFLGYMRSLAFNPKSLGKDRELYAKLLGWLTERREETHKVEFTASDYTQIGRATIEGLRNEYKELGGCCPVCGEHKTLRNEACLDTEPEQPEDREVATLALPTRPD